MARFNGLVLTNQGENLYARGIESAIPLKITRIVVGDGELPAGQSFKDVAGMSHEVFTAQGVQKRIIDDNIVQIEFDYTSETFENGFWFREIGIFADDPEYGEILYAYENTGDFSDYIPPNSGATYLHRIMRIFVKVASAPSVQLTVIHSVAEGYWNKKFCAIVGKNGVHHEKSVDYLCPVSGDCSGTINQALAENQKVLLLDASYEIEKSLNISAGKSLSGQSENAKIIRNFDGTMVISGILSTLERITVDGRKEVFGDASADKNIAVNSNGTNKNLQIIDNAGTSIDSRMHGVIIDGLFLKNSGQIYVNDGLDVWGDYQKTVIQNVFAVESRGLNVRVYGGYLNNIKFNRGRGNELHKYDAEFSITVGSGSVENLHVEYATNGILFRGCTGCKISNISSVKNGNFLIKFQAVPQGPESIEQSFGASSVDNVLCIGESSLSEVAVWIEGISKIIQFNGLVASGAIVPLLIENSSKLSISGGRLEGTNTIKIVNSNDVMISNFMTRGNEPELINAGESVFLDNVRNVG